MARRRGFFAEIQHQAQVAARQAEQQQRAALASQRRAEQALKAEQRAIAASQRASEADRKRLERELAAAHVAAMQAQVDQLNEELQATYSELDGLLAATIHVDDFIDLNGLKQTATHPPFDRWDLEVPTPEPSELEDPPEPSMRQPERPKGIFGRAKKLEAAQAEADREFAEARRRWEEQVAALPARRAQAAAEFAAAEEQREGKLRVARDRYAAESAVREAQVADYNASVDKFISDLSYGAVDAVKEYVGIVLANSVYPEVFPVEHDADFDPTSAELRVKVLIPGPTEVPTTKAYKYVRATDEIAKVELPLKEQKGRYASIASQVALRTLHEVFEADRRNIVQSISLEVGTETISPATGKETYVPFVAVAATRGSFSEIDLSAVVPAATLEHIGAAISRSPFNLVPANPSGVRRS